jgi:hypothetical protein
MTKEALKLALDWFKCYADKSMSRNNAEALADEVVEALEKALAQPEQEQNEFELRGMLATLKCWHRLTQAEQEDLLRFAAAQPEQEPVAWAMFRRGRLDSFWMNKGDAYDYEFTSEHEWKPLYTTPPTAQPVPVPLAHIVGEIDHTGKVWTPAQRTWVGLTEEDKHLIELSAGITEDDDGYIVSQVFKLTEAKLKEKNCD